MPSIADHFLLHPTYHSGSILSDDPSSALSTMEASVLLLRQASHQTDAHQSLLDVFDRMIQMQIDAMGEAVYQKLQIQISIINPTDNMP